MKLLVSVVLMFFSLIYSIGILMQDNIESRKRMKTAATLFLLNQAWVFLVIDPHSLNGLSETLGMKNWGAFLIYGLIIAWGLYYVANAQRYID